MLTDFSYPLNCPDLAQCRMQNIYEEISRHRLAIRGPLVGKVHLGKITCTAKMGIIVLGCPSKINENNIALKKLQFLLFSKFMFW